MPAEPRVLLVEDDDLMRLSLEDRLRMEGFRAEAVATCAEARRVLTRTEIDLLVTDVRLPDGTGRDLFSEVMRDHMGIPVILMTAYGAIPDAVALVKAGAYDYLTKPFSVDEFIQRTRGALEERLENSRRPRLVLANGEAVQPGRGHLGKSPAMRNIEKIVARIAPLDSSVLITGESGVGKEVVADLLHRSSRRADKPFIKVNCAAIPLSLVESELFGHEKGAFTGAARRRIGRFEQAQGGTIFLDEIAEVPPEVQVKLLRVLQEKVIERVGSNDGVPLDVRVIAATQVDLQPAIEQGRFRGDLYWRLNVIRIEVPPLRARPEDIPCLARRFVNLHAAAMGRPVVGLSPEAEARLLRHAYPGNVRELKNVTEHAVAMCEGTRIAEHDLDFGAAQDHAICAGSLRDALEEAERDAIRLALDHSGWAMAQAAAILGISRKSLWEKMRRYGIARGEEGCLQQRCENIP